MAKSQILGGKIMKKDYTGNTQVASPWSDGERRTRFTISLSEDGMISVNHAPKSRTPDFWDVWNALHDFIVEEMGLSVPNSTPKKLRRIRNCMGVTYFGVNGHFIGRSSEGKFSFRGEDFIPLEDLRVLLYPLKTYLEEEKT